MKKKEKVLKTETKVLIFSFDYANITSLVTPRLVSAFKGEYPIFPSDINFLNFARKLRFK